MAYLEFFTIPMRPRLNSDQIEAELIANRCQIWSFSPHERRTYAEEETEQILFNRRNLDPNICVNWVSSVNRSFILQQL